MTLVVSIGLLGTLFTISNIQKTQIYNNAISDIKIVAKSLNNNLLKILLNPETDSLADITFRLSAFDKINGLILYNKKNEPIYRYGKIINLQNNKDKILKNNKFINDFDSDDKNIYIKENITANGYKFGYIIVDVTIDSYKQKYRDLMIKIVQIFPFALLFSIILSLFLSKRYTKPFGELLNAMEKSDPTKDKIVIVKTSAKNEIKDLFDGFNNQMKQISLSTKEINKLTQEIEDTQKEVVFTMGAIGESRSKETGNHVKRVAEYSKLLAIYYGLNQKDTEMLKQASPMHDIGKVAIPDAILNKPGRFNEEERKIMNTHAQLGYDMLKMSNRPLLKLAATVAYEHHEKWDGSGYPRKLKGKEISIAGRITALADVFDALGSDRVYKKAWDDGRIFKLFKEERGKHFDPKLVDIFFDNLDEFLKVREQFKDVTDEKDNINI